MEIWSKQICALREARRTDEVGLEKKVVVWKKKGFQQSSPDEQDPSEEDETEGKKPAGLSHGLGVRTGEDLLHSPKPTC